MNPLDIVEAQHAMAGLAATLRAYFVALLAEGFTTDEALALTLGWQTAAVSRGSE